MCPHVELLECDDLHSVIRLVLKTGNYMNAVSVYYLVLLFLFYLSGSLRSTIFYSIFLFFLLLFLNHRAAMLAVR